MANSDSVPVSVLFWGVDEVTNFIEEIFNDEIALQFQDQDIDGESLVKLLEKDEDAKIFNKIGLATFGKVVRLKKEVKAALALTGTCTQTSGLRSVFSPPSPKPSLMTLQNISPESRLLYKTKRSRIQRAAVVEWPGNRFPNFRLAEHKVKLDALASQLEEECGMPEINFGVEGIKQHIKAVFWERRRNRKSNYIDYDEPDKRSPGPKESPPDSPEYPSPPSPVCLPSIVDDNSDGGDTDPVYSEDEQGSSDDNVPFSQPVKETKAKVNGPTPAKKKKLQDLGMKKKNEHVPKCKDKSSSESESAREVTAINLSDKSAEVIVLVFAKKSSMSEVSRDYMLEKMREVGAKMALAKTLSKGYLVKALAVKLIKKNMVKLDKNCKLQDVKRAEVKVPMAI